VNDLLHCTQLCKVDAMRRDIVEFYKALILVCGGLRVYIERKVR
jgi:hypothetical protein